MNKLLPCYAGLLFGAAVGLNAATTVHANLDFETSQYPNNFRVLNANGATLSQTANGAGNDFMRSVNGSGSSVLYDANGSTSGISSFSVSATQSLTVSADVNFTVSNNSFGVYIVNAANEAQGYLAIFNVNFSGTNDQLRFASNAVPTTSGAGTLVAGSYPNNADSGIGLTAFGNISLTYSINELNNPVLTMTAGTQTSSIAFSSISTPFTEVEIGFRFGSSSGTIGMDNLTISTTSIPEPSTYAALAGVIAIGACIVRRRIVR
jgi:hypothetical protein